MGVVWTFLLSSILSPPLSPPDIDLLGGQGPTALAVVADGGVWTFFLSSIISLFFLPLCGRRPDGAG